MEAEVAAGGGVGTFRGATGGTGVGGTGVITGVAAGATAERTRDIGATGGVVRAAKKAVCRTGRGVGGTVATAGGVGGVADPVALAARTSS